MGSNTHDLEALSSFPSESPFRQYVATKGEPPVTLNIRWHVPRLGLRCSDNSSLRW